MLPICFGKTFPVYRFLVYTFEFRYHSYFVCVFLCFHFLLSQAFEVLVKQILKKVNGKVIILDVVFVITCFEYIQCIITDPFQNKGYCCYVIPGMLGNSKQPDSFVSTYRNPDTVSKNITYSVINFRTLFCSDISV